MHTHACMCCTCHQGNVPGSFWHHLILHIYILYISIYIHTHMISIYLFIYRSIDRSIYLHTHTYIPGSFWHHLIHRPGFEAAGGCRGACLLSSQVTQHPAALCTPAARLYVTYIHIYIFVCVCVPVCVCVCARARARV